MSGERRILARTSPAMVPAGEVPSLPGSVVEESGRRVRATALTFGALWLVALLIQDVLAGALGAGRAPGAGAWPWPGTAIAAVGMCVSLATAFVAARWRDRPARVIDLALAFQVVTAALIALLSRWDPDPRAGAVTWTTLVIAIFPWIAVTTVRRALAAALLAAAMDPLALLLAHARGVPFDGAAFDWVWICLPNFIVAALTVMPTRLLRGLGRQVERARELGSYRLGERLGGGGMGEVHRATHRLLAREAAVKLIRQDQIEDPASPAAQRTVERFRREAAAAASLRSVHTIELYDFGVAEDGTFYYAMELLDGMDLWALVDRFGAVPPERAIHLLRQACDSLAEAHAKGLVHRDIKPSNIVTCRMGMTVDFVKVLDFGLVKRGHEPGDGPALTSPELCVGTPGFLAPEAILADPLADQRVDIYALGCVAYWLLTGTSVFPEPNTMALLVRHLEGTPEPPSRRSPWRVPPGLDEIVLACLAKRPADRIADATELERRLRGCVVEHEWTEERMRAWWAAHVEGERAAA